MGEYVRIYGNIIPREDRIDISAESIKPIEDWNELTRHYLAVISARCIRMFGAMPIERTEKTHLNEGMQKIVDCIKKLRVGKGNNGVEQDEVFDPISDVMGYDNFIQLVNEMCEKKILRRIDGNIDLAY